MKIKAGEERVEIFDVDGTLWRPVCVPLCVSPLMLTHPKWAVHARDYAFIEGVADRLHSFCQEGAVLVGATNQGGLPWNPSLRGQNYKSLHRLQGEIEFLFEATPLSSIFISPAQVGVYLSVDRGGRIKFHLNPGRDYHKPAPEMLLEIWRRFPDKKKFRFWGDRPSDATAAAAAAAVGMPIVFEWAENLKN